MFDWVPLRSYTDIHYIVLLLIVLVLYGHSLNTPLASLQNKKTLYSFGIFVLIYVLLYMGLRPVSGFFGDMVTYNRTFKGYAYGMPITSKRDLLFQYFMFYSSKVMTATSFFFVCAALYTVTLWAACKKWFGHLGGLPFLMLVASFSFWAYGTNGIRNGIATSLFLFAISRDRWVWRILLLWLAFNVHSSMAIPIAAYAIANIYTQPKTFLYFYILCIPLSLVAGGAFQSMFAGMMEDDRVSYLTAGNVNNDNFSSTGFRWDFLAYSASAVYAGWWYIFKKKYDFPFYKVLYCTYLAANGFWILVIKANFSNRFAYLSWFMMAIVIIFPLLKHKFVPNQNQLIAYILLAYYGFTFFMNYIL